VTLSDKGQRAQANAQRFFSKSAGQEGPVKHSVRAERAQQAAKTAKLRALRLAKEQGEKDEAERLALETPAQKPGREKPIRKKRAGLVRMSY